MPRAAPHHNPLGGIPRFSKSKDDAAARQAARFLPTYSKQWRRIRARQLARQPLCETCRAQGFRRAASHVDHVDGDSSNNDASNLQSLCLPHHSQKTAKHDGGFGHAKR